MRAPGHLKPRFKRRIQQGIAIRRLHRINTTQVGIVCLHLLLDRVALAALPAIQAQHSMQAAVQFDHIVAAGLIVQGIDVLRDQSADPATLLQRRQRLMRGIRSGLTHARPAEHRSRPITPA